MSVSPGHRGALDVYVPLVDWGARFEAIRRRCGSGSTCRPSTATTATDLAEGAPLNVEQARGEARDALAAYLKRLIALMVPAALALGLLVAFAIRSQVPRLRWTSALAVVDAAGDRRRDGRAGPAARGDRQPAVLRPRPGHPARAGGRGGGPARLGRARPGARRAARRPRPAGDRPREAGEPRRPARRSPSPPTCTTTPFGLGVLRAAGQRRPGVLRRRPDRPRLAAGDERRRAGPRTRGKPFVFVTGNHDSDFLAHELASEGAIVLTRTGRLLKPTAAAGR